MASSARCRSLLRAVADSAFRKVGRAVFEAHRRELQGADAGTRIQLFMVFGRKDEALKILDSLVQARSEQLGTCTPVDPALEPLHGDPRWTKLLAAMGIR